MYDETITDFAAGDDLTIERTVTLISGELLQRVWFTVKQAFNQSDYLIRKTLVSGATASGILDNPGTNNIAHFKFYLLPEDTVILTALSEYPYDIQFDYVSGKKQTYELGIIVAFPQVTTE